MALYTFVEKKVKKCYFFSNIGVAVLASCLLKAFLLKIVVYLNPSRRRREIHNITYIYRYNNYKNAVLLDEVYNMHAVRAHCRIVKLYLYKNIIKNIIGTSNIIGYISFHFFLFIILLHYVFRRPVGLQRSLFTRT